MTIQETWASILEALPLPSTRLLFKDQAKLVTILYGADGDQTKLLVQISEQW
jgi:hypothetical protein